VCVPVTIGEGLAEALVGLAIGVFDWLLAAVDDDVDVAFDVNTTST
jgi:hypothetical protein